MRAIGRHKSPLVCALLIAATVVAKAATPEEQALFDRTNQARAAEGLAPLRWDQALADAARAHDALLVGNGELSHRYANEEDLAARAAEAGAHFETVAENIAAGPSIDSIQSEWMKSPPHRANILDPRLDAVGFAVARRGDSLYAVADFERRVASLDREQVEGAIAKLLAAREFR